MAWQSSVRRPRLVSPRCCTCWDCGPALRFVVYPDGGEEDEAMNDIDKYGDFTESFWFSGKPGEALEHIKKFIRDGYLDADALQKELGDVIYYWARICRYFGFKCSDVIAGNIAKLESRRARGKLRGDGDDR
jgi:NTP pyrophosphatase (non-canonical NTP hydrolase)